MKCDRKQTNNSLLLTVLKGAHWATTHAANTSHNNMNIWCFIVRRKKLSVATNCAVSSVLETTTEKTKLKLTLICPSVVSVVELNEIFGKEPPRQMFLAEVLLAKKHAVCNACILYVIYGLFKNWNTANTCMHVCCCCCCCWEMFKTDLRSNVFANTESLRWIEFPVSSHCCTSF